jgi:cytochrome c oxidase assembly protein subunit 15
VALAWRAAHARGDRPRASDRRAVWAVRGLVPLGAVTIFAGTVATAAGPHAGGSSGDHVPRLTFKGTGTLAWAIHQHATLAAVFGVCALALWFFLQRWGAEAKLREAMTGLVLLLAAQGLVGSAQYELHLPSEMVWVHVLLATLTWLSVLWAAAAAGRLAPQGAGRRVERLRAEPV